MEKKLIAGPRGGYYWIDENEKKHYVKGAAKKSTSKSTTKKEVIFIADPEFEASLNNEVEVRNEEIKDTRKLMHYTANITVYTETGEYKDDFNEWREAYSEEEAMNLFREDYEDPDKYEIMITNVTEA